ncbi:MAG: RnfABCDGE type electron transport complex subunit D [Proteobacteria bacterium]|nr:RnfABCDGE type electron transport complex subunit D [Pseudomonadota bacterium]
MSNRLIVATPPYIKNGETNHCLMFDVWVAALPMILTAIYFFGPYSLVVIFLSIFSAIATEAVIQMLKAPGYQFRPFLYSLLTNEKITIMDGSALVTGLLLAFNLPPQVPFWLPVVGSVVAISLGKQVFGGLGQNIFNPALFARAFLVAAWPAHMTSWVAPFDWNRWLNQISSARSLWMIDAVSSATPLALMKQQGTATPYLDLFLGNIGGCLGEVSALAVLIGGAYLLYKGTITWHIPVTYLGTVVILSTLFGRDPLFHLFSGGLMLGTFFMATDVVTSPVTKPGRIFFGIGCGVLTVLIRLFGSFPEGVSYSILLMNACTPLIDRYTGGAGLRRQTLGALKTS